MRVFISVLLLIVAVGFICSCSSNDDSEPPKTEIKTTPPALATEEPVKPVYNFDSLAEIRYSVRSENNPLVTIETDMGNMTLELYRDMASAHADSFVARTEEGFYDGLIFHRIIDEFMIQTGDARRSGRKTPGYFLPAEFSDLPHIEGTLSMARKGGRPNSATTQFFICLGRARCRSLDKQYSIFGQLVNGFDVLHRLGSVEVVPSPSGEPSRPKQDVFMRQAYLSDSLGNKL